MAQEDSQYQEINLKILQKQKFQDLENLETTIVDNDFKKFDKNI